MAAAPVRVRTACVRSRLLAPVCPRRLPAVESQAWDTMTCLAGTRGCLGLHWDDLELEHVSRSRRFAMRPPTWGHVSVFAGDLSTAFPFAYPRTGRPVPLRDGLYEDAGPDAIFFGSTTWGGRTGTLVLAPSYPRGGEQGGHLVFRWRAGGQEYAIGVHAWEPLTQAAATLRAIVLSAGA
jgi:hypothetical protein